jgi:methionyl-tRNA synthetase
MLPADVYARYLRATGADVLLICATDEHGTPAELAAAAAGLSVEEYCRQQHAIQAGLNREFGLSFDHFGRTSSRQNHELTQHFADRLEAEGLIEPRWTRQVFSLADQRFLPDRYVTGTCPHCGYDRARGDQCEQCTRVLEATDLIDPRSAISGSRDLEVRESRHLFFRLPLLTERLRAWVESHPEWPSVTLSIARKWLDEGLQDRGITRDLYWGVPVNRAGFEGKVFYVWFDAPIGYIAATKEWADLRPGERDWRSWWLDAQDVDYTQFMAKDNVPFHTILFPAAILGTGEAWKLPDYIKAFSWLTYDGGKFSTSQHRGVFMSDALELVPSDYWRYALLANAPEASDADFSWDLFAATCNKDLVGVFGNFVNRTVKFVESRFGGVVPAGGVPGAAEAALAASLAECVGALDAQLRRRSFRKAIQELRTAWVIGNAYLADAEPWKFVDTDPPRAAVAVRTAVNLVRLFAVLASPVLPTAGASILAALELESPLPWPQGDISAELTAIEPGRHLRPLPPLFRRIDTEDVAAWRVRFSGIRAAALDAADAASS